MPEIKRPNYFTSQFLVEKDFNDEQSYHLGTRRRHNRVAHTMGVADGLDVSRSSPTEVQVSPGTAFDRDGREIVLNDSVVYKLVTAGAGRDVFLTIAYHEDQDAADRYPQAPDKFVRTTERPLIQDSAAAPPTDGSVILLARIHLSESGIESDASIITAVRTISSARIAPAAITTTQLANDAVTVEKLADPAKPRTLVASNAITIAPDDATRKITIGESHSARTDNPHATTAAQVDAQGGTNQLVAQINNGSGIISRAHVESNIVSGVVTFQSVASGFELRSADINPGFGPGALHVDFAFDDLVNGITLSGDTSYGRTVTARAELNRAAGTFRVFVARAASPPNQTGDVKVRWFASRPTAGSDSTVAVSVDMNPLNTTLANNASQAFTAKSINSTNEGVTWSIDEQPTLGENAGSLVNVTFTSATYIPPGISGRYHVTAKSIADPSKKATATIDATADVSISLNVTSATVIRGNTLTLTATVINTTNQGVNWSATGGQLSATAGGTVVWTPPNAEGTYTVTAASAAAPNKTRICQITVPAISITISPPSDTVLFNQSTTLRAIVSGTTNQNAVWEPKSLGSVNPTFGSTTTWFAPGLGGEYTVRATADADRTKFFEAHISVPPRKDRETKLQPIETPIVGDNPPIQPFLKVQPAPEQSPPATSEPFIPQNKRPGSGKPPLNEP